MNILLGRKNIQQTFVQLLIYKLSYLHLTPQVIRLFRGKVFTQSKDLPLLADDQDIRFQCIAQYMADVTKHKHLRRIIVKQFVDFSCLIQ